MTEQDKDFLDRITGYANEVCADIDPQKTQISVQHLMKRRKWRLSERMSGELGREEGEHRITELHKRLLDDERMEDLRKGNCQGIRGIHRGCFYPLYGSGVGSNG